MRQLFKSYDDYRKVVDELKIKLKISRLEDFFTNKGNYIYNRQQVSFESHNECKRLQLGISTTELLSDIDLFINLEELEIHTSSLTSLPDTIENLENLKILRIYSKNYMVYHHNDDEKGVLNILPKNINKLANLQEITIFNQSVSEMPENMKFLTNLKEISLDKNDLKEIPLWIGSIFSLESLDFCNNPIISLPKSIAELPNLKKLYAVNCQISSIPVEIEELKSVTIRLAKGNRLPLTTRLKYGLRENNEWK